MNELGMLLEKIDTLEDVTKERDIYRAALIEITEQGRTGEDAYDMVEIAIDALGKKRMKND